MPAVLLLPLAAPVYGSNWPGPLIWKTDRPVSRTSKSELLHEGSFLISSDFREVFLNQVKEFDRSRKITWSYTRRILKVKDGRSSKDRVTVKSWEWLEQDGLPDNSLTKYTFDFLGADRGRSRRLVNKGSDALTENAQQWANRNLRSVDEPVLVATWPRKPVARAGDKWSVDPLRLAISLNLDELSRINASNSKAQAKLVALRVVDDVTWGKYVVESKLTLGQLPGTKAAWREGGELALKVTIDGPLEPGPYGPYVIKIVGDLSGKGLIRGNSGKEILRDVQMTLQGEWTRSAR
ncbi:MAG: hypothetical protein VYC39_08775 [Myxococcota bacterium]|nr:hypothetical protein [Myxococcota bacterium]